LFISQLQSAIPDSLVNKIKFSSISETQIKVTNSKQKDKKLNRDPYWLYFNYDNENIKLNNLNDSGFVVYSKSGGVTLGEQSDNASLDVLQFKTNGWYKIYFKMPPDGINKIYELSYSLIGAAEIFLDGKLQKKVGKIDHSGRSTEEVRAHSELFSFYINDTLVHCVAYRYAFSNYSAYFEKYNDQLESPVFEFLDQDNNQSKNDTVGIFYSITNMLSAFFFALFIIHLLIYFYYKEKSFNLLYSLFLLLLSLAFLEVYTLQFVEDAKLYLWLHNIDNIIFPTVCFLLVTLLNKLLNEKNTWHYMGLCVVLVLLVIDVLFIRQYTQALVITIIFYTYFNTLAHSIKGVRRKTPSAKFLGWGILSFTLSFVLLIFASIVVAMISTKAISSSYALFVYIFLIILAILSIPLSMTAYLAYDFARTNIYLADKLKENVALNEKSLKHEKEKQDLLLNQNQMLETQVAERTKEIADQNKVLEHQKKEITDSINYAKRIQQALLPELSEIKSKLPNSFVFYLPKDIVSGDFYFFQSFTAGAEHPGRTHQNNQDGVFIAAADCTGHGVPGALMSMIVHEKLEGATKIFSEPKDILKSINKQVKDALKQYQSESASRDGCDIAFLKIVGNNLSYAGAFRPIYLFDKQGALSEIKATKTAIAGLTPYDQEFAQTEIDTTQLKAIYVFSDGFADQFGGSKSKKLTTKKFKELLSSIVNLPVEAQNLELERFFIDWKGNVEQIDDVLVIGITF